MSKKVLVVDDEPLILLAVERALSRIGLSISKAQNMKELDEALRNAPFDLLVTDIHVADINIDNIITKVKVSSPDLAILKMSGSRDKAGTGHFIEKPFRIDELRKRVRDILNEPSRD